MTSIPQLRRDINDMRAKVREAEADRDAAIARPPKEVVKEVVKKVPTPCPKQARDIEVLKEQLAKVRARPPKEVVKEVVKKVPTPCPKQARDIEVLKEQLAKVRARPPKEVVREVIKKVPAPEQADQIKQLSAKLREAEAARDAAAKEQADQIKTLQSKLARFAKYDMKEFERWRKMCAIAEGK